MTVDSLVGKRRSLRFKAPQICTGRGARLLPNGLRSTGPKARTGPRAACGIETATEHRIGMAFSNSFNGVSRTRNIRRVKGMIRIVGVTIKRRPGAPFDAPKPPGFSRTFPETEYHSGVSEIYERNVKCKNSGPVHPAMHRSRLQPSELRRLKVEVKKPGAKRPAFRAIPRPRKRRTTQGAGGTLRGKRYGSGGKQGPLA